MRVTGTSTRSGISYLRPGARSWLIVGLPLFAIVAAASSHANAQLPERYRVADLKALQAAFVEVAEDVRPSVVAIRTYLSGSPDRGMRTVTMPHSQGSGFVIDPDGYIATNYHVVEGSDRVNVILTNGDIQTAEVVQVDQRRDLAVLKIAVGDLPAVRFGDGSAVKVSEWAFACGNPFGMANRDGNVSVSVGTISALNRHMTDALVGRNSNIEYYGDLIETTAAINPGNSGGPLFNVDGEVIGIVTAIETSSGVSEGAGFAIPMNKHTRAILATLKSGDAVRYGFMGVSVDDDMPPSLRRVSVVGRRGARIAGISPPDGPAAKAGLRQDDIVVAVDGKPVADSDHLVRLIQYRPVGSEVDITFLRKRVKRHVTLTLADRNDLLKIGDSE